MVVLLEVEDEAITRAWEKVHTGNRVRDDIRTGMKTTDVFKKYGVL